MKPFPSDNWSNQQVFQKPATYAYTLSSFASNNVLLTHYYFRGLLNYVQSSTQIRTFGIDLLIDVTDIISHTQPPNTIFFYALKHVKDDKYLCLFNSRNTLPQQLQDAAGYTNLNPVDQKIIDNTIIIPHTPPKGTIAPLANLLLRVLKDAYQGKIPRSGLQTPQMYMHSIDDDLVLRYTVQTKYPKYNKPNWWTPLTFQLPQLEPLIIKLGTTDVSIKPPTKWVPCRDVIWVETNICPDTPPSQQQYTKIHVQNNTGRTSTLTFKENPGPKRDLCYTSIPLAVQIQSNFAEKFGVFVKIVDERSPHVLHFPPN